MPLASSAAAHSATAWGATRNANCTDSAPCAGGSSSNRAPCAVSAKVVEPRAMCCERQGRRTDTILDPAITQGTQQREFHNVFVEVPHRIHVASEDNGVVDLSNLAERLHGDGSLVGLALGYVGLAALPKYSALLPFTAVCGSDA